MPCDRSRLPCSVVQNLLVLPFYLENHLEGRFLIRVCCVSLLFPRLSQAGDVFTVRRFIIDL